MKKKVKRVSIFMIFILVMQSFATGFAPIQTAYAEENKIDTFFDFEGISESSYSEEDDSRILHIDWSLAEYDLEDVSQPVDFESPVDIAAEQEGTISTEEGNVEIATFKTAENVINVTFDEMVLKYPEAEGTLKLKVPLDEEEFDAEEEIIEETVEKEEAVEPEEETAEEEEAVEPEEETAEKEEAVEPEEETAEEEEAVEPEEETAEEEEAVEPEEETAEEEEAVEPEEETAEEEEAVEPEEETVEEEEAVESLEGTVETETFNEPSISLFHVEPVNPPDTYYAGNDVTFRTTFGLSESSGDLTNSILEMRIPKQYIQKDTVRASNFSLQLEAPTITEDENDYIIRYKLETVGSGTVASVPFSFTPTNGYVPNGYSLPITAKLLNADEVDLVSDDTVVEYETRDLELTKHIKTGNTWSSNSRTVVGGREDPENPDYLSGDIEDLVPVEFGYRTNYDGNDGRRYYEEIVISDILPEGAVFIQEENPNWTFDEDTRIVSYKFDIPEEGLLLGNIDYYRYQPDKNLKLYFPKVKIGEYKTNTMTMDARPFQRPDYEDIVKVTDDIPFALNAIPDPILNSNGFRKHRTGSYQVMDRTQEKIDFTATWTLTVSNLSGGSTTNPTDIENIVVHDNGLDENLYFSSLRIPRIQSNVFEGTLKVEAILDDDSIITLEEELSPSSGITTIDLMDLGQKVKEIKVSSNSGSVLKPGGSLNIYPESKFRDPENVTTPTPTTNLRMYNYTSFSANYVGGTTTTIEDNTYYDLTPVPTPTINLTKSTSNSASSVYVGDIVEYQLQVRGGSLLEGQVYELTEIVDLLPAGVEYVSNSAQIRTNGTFSSENSIIPEPQIVLNYQNTGQTAIVWSLVPLTSTRDYLGTPDLFTINYKTRITTYAEEGTNENIAYLGWANNEEIIPYNNSKSTPDIYDINHNGDTTDTIVKDTSKVEYVAPETMIISKSVKGNLDSNYLMPPAYANAEIGTDASYQLNIRNNSPQDINTLTLLDVLPHVGDMTTGADISGEQALRNSDFPITLTGPITELEGYTIYYTADPPTNESASYTTDANWQTSMDDYSSVRAVKIILNEDHILERGESISLEMPIFVPKDYGLEDDDQTVNSFGQSLTNQLVYTESNNATLKIVKYKVNGYVFEDVNRDGYKDEDEPIFPNHTVTLVDEDGEVATDLEGNPYSTETDENGYYEMEVYRQGNYRIQIGTPEDYNLTNAPEEQEGIPNHIIDETNEWTNVFELNPNQREANLNAGYYSEYVSIEGTKTWEDADNQDGKRPDSITVRLLANGEEVAEVEVSEETDWSYSFTDLPKFENGEEINYTIQEDDVADYSTEINGMDITNSYTPGKTSINVVKRWEDANNQDGTRPDSITVTLLADGEETGLEQQLTADNNWQADFTDLDEYKDGELIIYTVEEVAVEGYESTITGNMENGYIITNLRVGVIGIGGTKTWIGDTEEDRPETITIQLLADDEIIDDIEVSAEMNWTYSFVDLKAFDKEGVPIRYTVQELEVENYKSQVNGFDITNTFIPTDPEKDDGERLPITATSIFNLLLIGLGLLVAGAIFITINRFRNRSTE